MPENINSDLLKKSNWKVGALKNYVEEIARLNYNQTILNNTLINQDRRVLRAFINRLREKEL